MEGIQNSELAASHRGLDFKEAGTLYPTRGLEKFRLPQGTGDSLVASSHVSGSVPETGQEEGVRRKIDYPVVKKPKIYPS